MLQFKKERNLKIISIFIAIAFIFNTTTYSIDISTNGLLRKELDFSNEKIAPAYLCIMVASVIGTSIKKTLENVDINKSIMTEKGLDRIDIRYTPQKFLQKAVTKKTTYENLMKEMGSNNVQMDMDNEGNIWIYHKLSKLYIVVDKNGNVTPKDEESFKSSQLQGSNWLEGRVKGMGNPGEFLDILNEEGKPTGKKKLRDDVHKNGDWHRTSNVVLFTNGGEVVLLKKKSERSIHHSMWTIPGGHAKEGADYKDTAVDEIYDEVGIKIKPRHLIYLGEEKYDSALYEGKNHVAAGVINREFRALWAYVLDGEEEAEVRSLAKQLRENRLGNDKRFSEIQELSFVPLAKTIEEVNRLDDTQQIYTPNLFMLIFKNSKIQDRLLKMPLMSESSEPHFGHSGNEVDWRFIEAQQNIKNGNNVEVYWHAYEAIRLLREVDFDELDFSGFPVADMVNQTEVAILVLEYLRDIYPSDTEYLELLKQLKAGVNGLELKQTLGYKPIKPLMAESTGTGMSALENSLPGRQRLIIGTEKRIERAYLEGKIDSYNRAKLRQAVESVTLTLNAVKELPNTRYPFRVFADVHHLNMLKGVVKLDLAKFAKNRTLNISELIKAIQLFLSYYPEYCIRIDTSPRIYISKKHSGLFLAEIDAQDIFSKKPTLVNFDSHNDSHEIGKTGAFADVSPFDFMTASLYADFIQRAFWIIPEFLRDDELGGVEFIQNYCPLQGLYKSLLPEKEPIPIYDYRGLMIKGYRYPNGARHFNQPHWGSNGWYFVKNKYGGIVLKNAASIQTEPLINRKAFYEAVFLEELPGLLHHDTTEEHIVTIDLDWFGTRNEVYDDDESFHVTLTENKLNEYFLRLNKHLKALMPHIKLIHVTPEEFYSTCDTDTMLSAILNELFQSVTIPFINESKLDYTNRANLQSIKRTQQSI